MNKIPKTVYFYWGAKTLPYLRYMTIYSFSKLNPDWKIKLYIPAKLTVGESWATHEQKYPVNNKECHFNDLYNIPNLEIITFDFTEINVSNDLSEVIKSDILRWHLLYNYGGLWSDMDILYIKPMSVLNKITRNITDSICLHPVVRTHFYSIGFILSSGKTSLYKLLNDCSRINNDFTDYQCIGSKLCESVLGFNFNKILLSHNKSKIWNLPLEIVYPNRSIKSLVVDKYEKTILSFTDYTVGLHWYAGHPMLQKNVNMTKKDYENNKNNIIELLVSGIN